MNQLHPKFDEITLTDAPRIEGLVFRHFCDETDYATLADIDNAAGVADHIDIVLSAEEMKNWYRPRAGFDPHQDILFALVKETAVAFAISRSSQEADGTRVYWPSGRVLPAWRRKGIGRAMLHHNEERLRAIAAHQPLDGPRTFLSYASETSTGNDALLRSEGYAPVRHYYDMVRYNLESLPEAPLPGALEVRPVLPEHYRAIWEAEQEAFRDNWGFSVGTEDDYQTWLSDPTFDPSLWQIAWDGNQVAGQVRTFISAMENTALGRKRGYTENISVRQPWRKRGLAYALIGLSLQALKERGMEQAALGVDTENVSGALRLYERCGFQVSLRSTQYRKPIA